MNNDSDNIEIRSEKVKNIIGQIPPKIIRIGISVIFCIFIFLLIGSYFFEYTHTIKTEAIIKTENGLNVINVKIPANEIDKVKIGQKIILNFNNIPNLNNVQVQGIINKIQKNLSISKYGGYYIADVNISSKIFSENNSKIFIENEIIVSAEIFTYKTTIFNKIIESIGFNKQNNKAK